ncbi:hypothetical protein K491DRAFT_717649 [Lophiostoma macrostomum CBS 122681]|uniref:HMG box domain-containing protein n=1 Tax=Lophiostoma macrostomum CBS 122681 TaxID=1314788 RepID=A0A6A6T1E4_9PLEO|nr:hypothetical protein K491DRAFT_717649 [Lophiostoma macrostomum CBS 122681]
MLARGVLSRVAADVPKTSTHDLPQLAHLLRRTISARNARSLPALSALSRACNAVLADARRSYATAARATKPTRKVVKDVKKVAAKNEAAPKKKAVAKKPKKKVVAKKAKPKKKAAAKPKTGRPRKVLTEEEKEKQTIKELKQKALIKSPERPHYRALDILLKESMAGVKSRADGQETLKESVAKYKAFTPAEREHYNHLANEATAAQAKTYRDWVHSHTPDQIRVANNARHQLKIKLAGKRAKRPAYTRPIEDDRYVKQPANAYARFLKERWASGDFKSMTVGTASKLLTDEWKALSAGEKKKYQDAFEVEHKTYVAEFKRTYGYDSGAA